MLKNLPSTQETQFNFWVGKFPWRRDRLPTPVFLGFPGGSDIKESACNAGDLSSISESERSPGEGIGNPLQYSCLENIWTEESGELATVHGITKSWTRLSDSHFPFLNPYVHISVLYVCISIPALEIGSSVLFPCGILVPGREIESAPPAVEAQSRYHGTSRVVPCIYLRHSSTLQAWR